MYIQEDICIVHLSDLHIQSQSKKKAVLARNLIKLIDDMLKYIFSDECIIVVSGDTTNKADYSKVNIDTILLFFQTIKNNFANKGISVKEIVFCPGNHDLDKTKANYDLLKLLMCHGCILDKKNRKIPIDSMYKAISTLGYGLYIKLVNNIREIFSLSLIESPFYHLSVDIKGYCLHFIAVDFAWNQSSDEINDALKNHLDRFSGLEIGDYQLNSLRSDFQKEQKNESDLVIVVSHYPLSWLKFRDYQVFLSDLLSPSSFHSNMYLCGHVHNNDAINYSTHEHSILTLVTGVGGAREKETWYSVYEINPIRNSCGIVVRKAQGDSDFIVDFSVYTKDKEREFGKILYPLRSPQKNLPYLRMNTPDGITDKDYFISSDVSKIIPKIASCIAKVHDDVSFQFSQMISELISEPISFNSGETIISDDMIEKYFTNESFKLYGNNEIRQFIEFFLTNQVDENGEIPGIPRGLTELVIKSWSRYCSKEPFFYLQGRFDSFMQEICDSYYAYLSEEIFPSTVIIRPHIRSYCKQEDSFQCFAYSTSPDLIQEKPKDIKYGSLIEQAYLIRKPLIFSANSKLNKVSTDWQEFITVVPDFEGYEIKFEQKDMKSRKRTSFKRPAISFGISVKNCNEEQLYEATRFFAIFDYLNLQSDLSGWIENFDYYFGLPWKENDND